MELILDLEQIEAIQGMTISRYSILYLLHNNQREWLNRLNLLESDDLLWLQQGNYVMLGEGTSESIILRPEGIALFEGDFDQMWNEFCSNYPYKVTDTAGNIRILRTLDPSAESMLKLKRKYQAITRSKPVKHKFILKCLNKQLEMDRAKLHFLQKLETWLNQKTYEKYAPFLNEEKVKNTEKIDYSRDI